jgi:predicted transcriptional regulator
MATLRNLMSAKLIVIHMDKPLDEAARLIAEHRIRHLPVINDEARIVGILDTQNISIFGQNQQLPVEFFMSKAIFHVEEDLPMKQAIFKMLENKISYLLLTDETSHVTGIVTTDDLLWCLASQIEQQAPLTGFFNRQTLGQIAYQLAQAGL